MDKRSKEWKQMSAEDKKAYTEGLKNSKKSKGLGDTIEKITKATGIKTVVTALFGEDCGCEERKIKLNKIFRYQNKVECLEESEFIYLKDFFTRVKEVIHRNDQTKTLIIYNRVFNENRKASSCSSCWQSIINKLKILYYEYEIEEGES